jgi:CRP-like cAMP-binding protein
LHHFSLFYPLPRLVLLRAVHVQDGVRVSEPNSGKAAVFLARLPLFNDVSPDALAHIAEATAELHLLRGATVFKRGDPCIGFYTVVYGQVKLAFASAQGDEKVVEIIGPGHSFGEALMFMDKPYILTATVLADALLLHVGQKVIFDEIDSNPLFARQMLAGLSRRLHGLVSDVEAYSLNSGKQRVIGFLLKDHEYRNGDRITFNATKTVVASRLNLTPEHFSRILRELSDAGLIVSHGKEIELLDIDRLRSVEK